MTEQQLQLTHPQKRALLALARRVVEANVTRKAPPDVAVPDDPALDAPCGCFVTLHLDGQLQGCIGTFLAQQPLHQTVVEMAKASLADPRFLHHPLRPQDLARLDIEISVLSPLTLAADPLALELGRHGIYIKRGYQSGCFLPQVATETGWDKEHFLSYCCAHKAGLKPDAWKDPKTQVFLFTAEVFSEHELP